MLLDGSSECDIVPCTFRVQLIRSTACDCLLMRSPVNVIFYGDMQFTDKSTTAFQYIDFAKREPECEGSSPYRQFANVC